jgi:hypothetical protein
MSTASEEAKSIQAILGVTMDGVLGPQSMAAFNALASADPASQWPPSPVVANPAPSGEVHSVIASSFADPADYRAWVACKAEGKSDKECYLVGDNCVGKWGDSTQEGTGPSCALPPEDWESFGSSAHLKKVLVQGNGKSVVCELKDTMPHKANITNGAGIDLNPDSVAALGWTPPIMNRVSWQWA